MITLDELKKIMPYAGSRAETYIDHLNEAMKESDINNPLRQAAFLANVAHESGSLKYVKELASGLAYEGRIDLGNVFNGDGVRYKGRGLLQITGRKNYEAVTHALEVDVLTDPELLETPALAARSAGWFWKVGAGLNLSPIAEKRCGYGCNLNEIADKEDFLAITYAINGGTNGYKDRLAYYERAQEVLA